MVVLPGVMLIETNLGAIVKFSEPLTESNVAVTETVPLDETASIPVALTEATPAGDRFQVTDEVKSLVELSLYLPVAFSCSVWPTIRFVLEAAT